MIVLSPRFRVPFRCLRLSGFLALFFVTTSASPARTTAAIDAPLTAAQRSHLETLLKGPLTRWQRAVVTDLLSPRTPESKRTLSRASASTDGEWSRILLPGIAGHTAIYDPVRDRMLVFGGYDYDSARNEVWALSLTGSPPWTKLDPLGTLPAARVGHTAIYDPVRDQMVIFGGYGFSDVWALSLAGTPEWTQFTPSGTPPSPRVGHTAIYDPSHDRMVVIGGDDWPYEANPLDVWTLSLSETPTWTELTLAGTPPTARTRHAAVYDSSRNRVLIFGGSESSYPDLNDTWALSLSGAATWTEINPTGPLPDGRSFHSAVYDPGQDRMVIYGGMNDGSGHFNDVWALSLSGGPSWAQITSPTGTFPGRLACSAIYDPVRVQMLIFGGEDDVYYPDMNDVWALSLLGSPEWTPAPGAPAPAREGHTAIYDKGHDRMVVFGGWGEYPYARLNDVWALSMSENPAWIQLSPSGAPAPARFRHTAIYDPVRSRMVGFGGYSSPGNLNDVWTLSLSGSPAWAHLSPVGSAPLVRQQHTSIYDPVRDRVVVFGGHDWPSVFNDAWTLSLSGTPTWTELNPAGTPPPPRYAHTAIYDPVRDRMVIFGGGSYPYLNDVWALTLSGTPTWSHLTPTGAISGKRSHAAIYDPVRDRMIVHADGVWALAFSGTPAWTQLTPTGPSVGRDEHSAIYDPVRDRMVVFAGRVDMHSDWNDVWELRWGTPTGVPTPPTHFVDALHPCYPNPFNPNVTIPFELRDDGDVTLAIYDVAGRLVKTVVSQWTPRGKHTASWDGRSASGEHVSSGVYFCRLRTDGVAETRKIVMLK